MPRRVYPQRYSAPGKDSDRAKAQAVQFLCSARSIDHVTPEKLAADYKLSLQVATYLLTVEQNRRERTA